MKLRHPVRKKIAIILVVTLLLASFAISANAATYTYDEWIGQNATEAALWVAEKVAGKAGRFIDEGWDMVKGGKVINGRYYSEHALERMAPDTLQVRAELEQRAIEKGLEPGTKAFNSYVDPRGIPPSVVEDAIQNGTPVPGIDPYTWVTSTNDVSVVINEFGDVITVIPR